MQSQATSVSEYLASLPPDRRQVVSAVRSVLRKSIDPSFKEVMQYGSIGYVVPHSLYPDGYHCDGKPLPYVHLAAQKNYCSLHLLGLYTADGDSEDVRWFHQAWKETGKRLDMGKSCVRFRTLDDLPLDVVAKAVGRLTAAEYIRRYEVGLALTRSGSARAKAKAAKPAPRAKPQAKSAAKKPRTNSPVPTKRSQSKRASSRA